MVYSSESDGTDGPTDAAGAIVSQDTLTASTVEHAKLALENHDSYTFFREYTRDCHILTGPTGTNVMDLVILCGYPTKENTSKI